MKRIKEIKRDEYRDDLVNIVLFNSYSVVYNISTEERDLYNSRGSLIIGHYNNYSLYNEPHHIIYYIQ